MKVRILNGAQGVPENVRWRDSKDSTYPDPRDPTRTVPTTTKTVCRVDFQIVDDEGESLTRVNSLRLPSPQTALQVATAVKARAKELKLLSKAAPTPVDIGL